jgi:hypothetical protein
MAARKGLLTGRCQGCNHPERVRIERFLATGGAIKGAARKFAIDYHALRRHWRNHVSAEARATYIAGPAAAQDQLEEIVADESLGPRPETHHRCSSSMRSAASNDNASNSRPRLSDGRGPVQSSGAVRAERFRCGLSLNPLSAWGLSRKGSPSQTQQDRPLVAH